ncbi:single-stranded DNA-binding protein [Actinoplanes sp. NPDC049316]|uniref:single-stranded DNA-binding protein n=1 Tax=Actinoplanes sp. NPDC049316 TaxID=3154727 RepID=UPI00342D93D4
MFDTNIVVIGNVLTAPEWRRTASSNTLVANFRVASTARRMDRETGRWVDGNHLRVRVNCWRRLAEGVASSVTVGDPVIVTGRLYTRDWTDNEGNLRTTYEMEAVSVGHDLSRGRAKFFRTKAAATTVVENPESEDKIRGELAAPIPDSEAPAVYGDGLPDGDEPTFEDVPARSPEGFDPVAALRGGGFEPFDTGITLPSEAPGSATSPVPTAAATSDPASAPVVEQAQLSIALEPAGAEPVTDTGPAAADAPSPRRVRARAPRRQPVAA